MIEISVGGVVDGRDIAEVIEGDGGRVSEGDDVEGSPAKIDEMRNSGEIVRVVLEAYFFFNLAFLALVFLSNLDSSSHAALRWESILKRFSIESLFWRVTI
jgi:hypothetical protein